MNQRSSSQGLRIIKLLALLKNYLTPVASSGFTLAGYAGSNPVSFADANPSPKDANPVGNTDSNPASSLSRGFNPKVHERNLS